MYYSSLLDTSNVVSSFQRGLAESVFKHIVDQCVSGKMHILLMAEIF